MRITNNSTNFQSKIKFIRDKNLYLKVDAMHPLDYYVPYPWTIETMKTGHDLYTTGIIECICGVLTDNNSSAMFHLATRDKELALRDKVNPFDITNIEEVLSSKVNLFNKNLHGFLLGGLGKNKNCLEQIKNLFEKYKIKYSIFANRNELHTYGTYSVLYSNKDDTLYLSNNLTEKKDYNKLGIIYGREIDIAKDGIIYNTYQRIFSKYGFIDKKDRIKTNLETFLKYQFKEVKLNELDSFA